MDSHKEKAARARRERRARRKDRKTLRWHTGQGFGSHESGEQGQGLENTSQQGSRGEAGPLLRITAAGFLEEARLQKHTGFGEQTSA